MSDGTRSTETGASHPGRRRRRRGRTAAIVLVGLLVLLVVAFFAADAALRAYAEDRVENEIRDRLPSTVEGDVEVRLGGAPVILQYLSGSFDRVDLDGQDLTIGGVPIEAGAVATGVPVDPSQPIERFAGTVSLTEDALNSLSAESSNLPANIRIGDGTLTYASSFRLLGFDVRYDITAEPRIEGDTVVLTPTDATLTSAPGSLDIGEVLGDNLASLAIPVCVAQLLPEGFTLTDLELRSGELAATVESTTLTLSEERPVTLGSCENGRS